MYWPKMSREEIARNVREALAQNRTYRSGDVLGFPGSFLDREVFPDEPFLRAMPYLTCLRENPNHIGCHTLTSAETAFTGTQRLEVDLLRLCAEEILGAERASYDGYVTSGGTECNIEALWIQRNYLRHVHGARPDEIVVLHSADTHYSIMKGADLLGLRAASLPVDDDTRQILAEPLRRAIRESQERGARFFVAVVNMGTTMFGSVDDIGRLHEELGALGVDYRIHVDAAFGGFIYPFSNKNNRIGFRDDKIVSVTLDGHKMLQAPYGTGIFVARRGLMDHVCTEEARYVHGKDYTLCGSRSGANAVALWMILNAYGSDGGVEFVKGLTQRTDRLCAALASKGVELFRDPSMNVVAIRARHVPREVAERYVLVPDTHEGAPSFWKIVVMDHVTDEALDRFVSEL